MKRGERPKRTDDGKFIECKFCHRAVWYDKMSGYVFELLGDDLHLDHCERRAAFYRKEGFEQSERARRRRA